MQSSKPGSAKKSQATESDPLEMLDLEDTSEAAEVARMISNPPAPAQAPAHTGASLKSMDDPDDLVASMMEELAHGSL